MSSFAAGGDEMAEYFRLFVEETAEQLDGLVEIMLRLEASPDDRGLLAEAFRLIHSIKGSSALLGLDQVTSLAHMLESHFDRLRSGKQRLDAEGMDVTLACVDFLRVCNDDIREGRPLRNDPALLARVDRLEQAAPAVAAAASSAPAGVPGSHENNPSPTASEGRPATVTPAASRSEASSSSSPTTSSASTVVIEHTATFRTRHQVRLRLRPGLPMAEMKVELLLARLDAVGTILACVPPREEAVRTPGIQSLVLTVESGPLPEEIRQAVDVDGVEQVDVDGVEEVTAEPFGDTARGGTSIVDALRVDAAGVATTTVPQPPRPDTASAASGPAASSSATVRVEVDRLDVLLNLTGELVVNRARLSQLAGEIAPAFRKSHAAGIATVETLRSLLAAGDDQRHREQLLQLADDLETFGHQLATWDEARGRFGELLEAVDQLTRVSANLQRGVLATRMVPVGPLFGRFKRSVRDIANELGKKVSLELVGEKTELDKRMIDEIGDPLNHLIRNSIDHGIEPADVRARAGKPAVATVRLSASHRGNNVFITVEDDGGGIDTDRVRRIAIDRGLLAEATADTLTESDLHELIWQPGFSTAREVSDISGRGVGMDIVRTKIMGLNGSIEVDSRRGEGTCFTIRLPLTLTIARCMLFRVAGGVFGVPIENVREIVSLGGLQRVSVGGRMLADVRGEMLPLAGLQDLFHWHGMAGQQPAEAVIVLQSGHRQLGLLAETLLGGQDVVIKPLDENFLHVRGLGGASVLGDGSVALLLDTAACIDLAWQQRQPATDVTNAAEASR